MLNVNKCKLKPATIRERQKRIINILPFLKKNWKILDCACGTGWLTDYLKQEGFNCYGVDMNTKKYIKADIRDLPFKSSSMDCIISLHTLEHVKCENEFKRVLKDNGLLIVEVPRWDFPIYLLTWLGLIQGGVDEHIRIVDFNKLPFELVFKKNTGYGLCKFGVFKNATR